MLLKTPFAKPLALYLVIAVLGLSFPAPGWAMLLTAPNDVRVTDLAAVRSALESTVVKQRLLDLGLTPEEASARLAGLPDEQLHRLAAELDTVQAGGLIDDVIMLLLIVIIVVVVLELTGHHIVVRR